MKSTRITILALSALAAVSALSSCNTRKEAAIYAQDGNAIRFKLELAGGDSFKSKDMVNISCESGTVSYMKSDDGWKPSGDGFFRWSDRTGELTFNAVYPAAPGVTYAQFFVPKNQNTPDLLEQANYSRGTFKNPQRPSDGTITIHLDRMMAKVRIKVEGLTGENRLQAVKIGSINGYIDVSSFNTKASDINPNCIIPAGGVKGGNGCVFEAYVIPGPSSSSVNLVSFSLNGEAFASKGIPSREAGVTYDYTLTINGNSFKLTGPEKH